MSLNIVYSEYIFSQWLQSEWQDDGQELGIIFSYLQPQKGKEEKNLRISISMPESITWGHGSIPERYSRPNVSETYAYITNPILGPGMKSKLPTVSDMNLDFKQGFLLDTDVFCLE